MTSTKLQPIFSILRSSILDFYLSAFWAPKLTFFCTSILLLIFASHVTIVKKKSEKQYAYFYFEYIKIHTTRIGIDSRIEGNLFQ